MLNPINEQEFELSAFTLMEMLSNSSGEVTEMLLGQEELDQLAYYAYSYNSGFFRAVDIKAKILSSSIYLSRPKSGLNQIAEDYIYYLYNNVLSNLKLQSSVIYELISYLHTFGKATLLVIKKDEPHQFSTEQNLTRLSPNTMDFLQKVYLNIK